MLGIAQWFEVFQAASYQMQLGIAKKAIPCVIAFKAAAAVRSGPGPNAH